MTGAAIEILGMVATKDISESRGELSGPQVDPGYLTRFARAHEAAAWDRAERIRAATAATAARAGAGAQVQGVLVPGGRARAAAAADASSVGSLRLQEQAARQEVYDDRLWYGITRLTGPGGNSTALVGTAAQVACALAAYRRAGADSVLIRGFDPLEDVVDWGRELVSLLREQAAASPPGGAPA